MYRKSFRRVHIRDPIVWSKSLIVNADWKLLLACTLHHLPIAREALAQGANVNCRRSDYLTPLHIAVQHNDVELLQLLCNHPSINIEAKTIDGLTALHKAALLGHIHSLEELIRYGASVNSMDNLGRYPLHYSALQKDIKSAAILITSGARVNVYDDFQESPLYTSVLRRRYFPMIKLLLLYGATISPAPNQLSLDLFLEAILCARNRSDMKVVDLLYRNGADVNTTDVVGSRTPLHIVAMTGNLKLAVYLIERGADLNRKNRAGYTPMKVAEMYQNLTVAQLIHNSLRKNSYVPGATNGSCIEDE